MAEWNTPKTNWAAGDIPMVDDFNRIEGNIDFLKQDIETKKGAIVNAINDMNQSAQVTDTHAQLASKIRDISKDATAAVGDVEKGKTFYAGGQKRTGTLELTGNAGTGDVLSGKTFYNTALKTKRTGTMPNRGAVVITPNTSNQTIQAGYHNGQGYVKGDANLVAANIKNGVSIFGVVGSMPKYKEINDVLVKCDESADYGSYIRALASDGTYLYAGGDTNKVWKINPSTMSKVAEINYGGDIYALASDGTYLYAGGAKNKVWKINPSTMSKVAEIDYGDYIRALAFDGTYLYAGGDTNKVWKINRSNMSKVAESAYYGGYIYALAFDGTYLYVGGRSTNKVWKINRSNMTKVAESVNYGGAILALASDGTYLYAGGATNKVCWKINPSTMSKVAEIDYGDYIRALAFDGTYLYAGGDTNKVWKVTGTVYIREV